MQWHLLYHIKFWGNYKDNEHSVQLSWQNHGRSSDWQIWSECFASIPFSYIWWQRAGWLQDQGGHARGSGAGWLCRVCYEVGSGAGAVPHQVTAGQQKEDRLTVWKHQERSKQEPKAKTPREVKGSKDQHHFSEQNWTVPLPLLWVTAVAMGKQQSAACLALSLSMLALSTEQMLAQQWLCKIQQRMRQVMRTTPLRLRF